MTLTTLFGLIGAVFLAFGAAVAFIAPRYPAYEDILQIAGGGSLFAGLCSFGVGLERVFGMVLLH